MSDKIKLSRRQFLRNASAATLATLAAGAPNMVWGEKSPEPSSPLLPATADSVILLWMAGGMAHTETFDPKPPSKYESGKTKTYEMMSTFPAVDTVVDDIKFSTGLDHIGQIMDRGTLIRSFSPPNLGHILHARHQFHWHTGYVPPQSIEVPHIGAMISKVLGSRNPDMPPFIHIGQRLDIDGAAEVRAFLTAGFLGNEFAPLLVVEPNKAMELMSPPGSMSMSRFQNRQALFKGLVEKTPVGAVGSDFQRESLMRSLENSYRLVNSPSARAFDLSLEKKEVLDTYNVSRFGRGCLLARRLVEAGARFVEVTTEHVPFGNWDTHVDGHRRTEGMKGWIDRPIRQLVLDLEERGLLNRTLIVLASEFSRVSVKELEQETTTTRDLENDPLSTVRNVTEYGMHRHFIQAGSVLLFGGGIRKGHLYGKTADEIPCQTIENPITLANLHATMFHALGIPADLSFEIERRPFYVTENGEGKPVNELFA